MITLRFVTPEDSAELLEIYRPYVEQTTVSFETEVPSPEVFRDRILEISRDFPYLAAVEDGQILGYAYAHPFHERAAFAWTVESTIYVRADCRGKGIGRQLYRALLDMLELQGAQTVCAVVTIPNDPSMAFHEAMGFREEGRLINVGFKLGQWRSVSYLCRRFSEETGTPPPLKRVWDIDRNILAEILKNPEIC